MLSVLKEITYYFSVFRKHIGYRMYIIFFLTGLAAITEAFGIALLLPLIEMIDSEMGAESSGITRTLQVILQFMGIDDSMTGVVIFIGAVFFLKGLIKFSEESYKSILSANLQREMKGGLFELYSRMDYRFYTKRNTGHFVNVIVSQVNKLIKAFDNYKVFLSEIIVTFAYLSFAFLITWQFATMTALAGLIILYFFASLNRYVKNLSRKRSVELGNLNKFLVQSLQSFKYVAATAQFEFMRKSVMKSIYRLTAFNRKTGIAYAFTDAIREPISVFIMLTIILIQVGFMNAPLAPILVSLILIHRAVGHIINIQGHWQQTLNSIGGLEMVEQEFEDVTFAQEPSGKIKLPPFHGQIEVKNVSFNYAEGEGRVLDNINLTVKANTTISLVGESGAGKTTLVDTLTLLLRPDEGEILIDGHHFSVLDQISWRKQIGYVSQDTIVFDDTIANNISMWKGDTDQDPDIQRRIETAAKQAFATEFIERMPNGYQTIVGDRGIRLSGGQKQRLFIARELFKRPRFLILDEATSALDSESERYIQNSIDNLQGQTTVVIIAHRLSTIRNCDQIYLLEHGRITEHGTYDELVESRQGFLKMVELQTL